jgi:hypothetical protein
MQRWTLPMMRGIGGGPIGRGWTGRRLHLTLLKISSRGPFLSSKAHRLLLDSALILGHSCRVTRTRDDESPRVLPTQRRASIHRASISMTAYNPRKSTALLHHCSRPAMVHRASTSSSLTTRTRCSRSGSPAWPRPSVLLGLH